MRFLRYSIVIFLFLLLVLHSVNIFARGGGGGRSSGGGGGFSGGYSYGGRYYHGHYYHGYGGYQEKFDPVATTVVVVITLVFFGVALFGAALLIRMRNQNAKRLLAKAGVADAFWDEQKMIDHGKEVFLKVQDAWSRNDLSGISHLLTNDFFNHYQHFLSRYTKINLRNIIKDIEIETARIVKVIDEKEDNKDTYLIYFKGRLTDYLVNTQSGIIVDGDKNSRDIFDDIYVFFRRDNQWKLNQIINDPDSKYMKLVKENRG